MEQSIENFIQKKRIAVVGVSRSPSKFGNRIFNELKQRGYEIYPVHPNLTEFEGQVCAKDLKELQGKVEGVVVCVSKDRVPDVLQQAAESEIKDVWLQQGAESGAALQTASELGLNLVTGKCVLMYAEPVGSFHKFHQVIARVFGQY